MNAFPVFVWIALAFTLLPAMGEARLKAIQGGTIVDPGGAGKIENGVILIQDDRIFKIGRAGEIDIPREVERIEVHSCGHGCREYRNGSWSGCFKGDGAYDPGRLIGRGGPHFRHD